MAWRNGAPVRLGDIADVIETPRISNAYAWAGSLLASWLVWYQLDPAEVSLAWCVFGVALYELPDLPRTSKGRPLVNLIELRQRGDAAPAGPEATEEAGGEEAAAPLRAGPERVRAFLAVKNFEQSSHYLTFASKQGIVKRTALKDYRNVSKAGLIAVGLKAFGLGPEASGNGSFNTISPVLALNLIPSALALRAP